MTPAQWNSISMCDAEFLISLPCVGEEKHSGTALVSKGTCISYGSSLSEVSCSSSRGGKIRSSNQIQKFGSKIGEFKNKRKIIHFAKSKFLTSEFNWLCDPAKITQLVMCLVTRNIYFINK